jgi:hypothetical protein
VHLEVHTIDESIADLVKALDATCRRHGLGRENLIRKLDAVNSNAVECVTKEARDYSGFGNSAERIRNSINSP